MGGGTTVTDLGGAYVGPTQDAVLALAQRLGVDTYKIHDKGRNVMMLSGRRSTYTGTIPSVGAVKLLDVNTMLAFLEDGADGVSAAEPWSHPRASHLDGQSVQDAMDAKMWTRDGKKLAAAAVKSVLCAEPNEVSLLYWLWYIKLGDGTKRLFDIADGAQERKFVGGRCVCTVRNVARGRAGRSHLVATAVAPGRVSLTPPRASPAPPSLHVFPRGHGIAACAFPQGWRLS